MEQVEQITTTPVSSESIVGVGDVKNSSGAFIVINDVYMLHVINPTLQLYQAACVCCSHRMTQFSS